MHGAVFVTMPQLRIVGMAKLFFGNIPPDLGLRSMFRRESAGLSVGLTCLTNGHRHIARETIGDSWSDGEVEDALWCIRSAIELSIARLA